MKAIIICFFVIAGGILYGQTPQNKSVKDNKTGTKPATATANKPASNQPATVQAATNKPAATTAKTSPTPPPVSYDTIVMLGGKKITANVQQVGSKEATYYIPSKPDSLIRVERKQLQRIIYKNGRVEDYSKPVLQMVDEGQWQAVTFTHDKKQINGLYKRGEVSAKTFSPKSKKAAQQQAFIKLQKKAASQGGSVILITDEQSLGGYGDVPGVYIEGFTYGDKPLEKGTNVVVDKDKKP